MEVRYIAVRDNDEWWYHETDDTKIANNEKYCGEDVSHYVRIKKHMFLFAYSIFSKDRTIIILRYSTKTTGNSIRLTLMIFV